MTACLFHFTGSGLEQDTIHFALSDRNDALHWRPLPISAAGRDALLAR